MSGMRINWAWAMPNGNTTTVIPIKELVSRYVFDGSVIIDPYARDCKIGTYTNDFYPATDAQYHMDSLDFLEMLVKKGTKADIVIFDPPFSPRQIKELYDGIGIKMKQTEALRTSAWSKEKVFIDQLLKPGGYFIYMNWNTTGMGKKHGYQKRELLVVNHGSGHNDTLVLVEQKPLPEPPTEEE